MRTQRKLLLLALWLFLVAYGVVFALLKQDMCVSYWDPSGGPRPSVVFYYSSRPATNAWLDAAFWPQGRLLEITGYWEFVREPF